MIKRLATLILLLVTSICFSNTNETTFNSVEIKAVVYTHMMTPQSKRDISSSYYGAYYIDAKNDNEFTQILKLIEFKDVVILHPSKCTITEKGVLVKGSNKPGKIFSVKEPKIKGDIAEVYSSWYSASMAAGGYIYKLQKVNSKWVIISCKNKWMS